MAPVFGSLMFLLDDDDYVKLITDFWSWRRWRTQCFPSLAQWWDAGKSKIKGLTIFFCSNRSWSKNLERYLLTRLTDHLKNQVDSGRASSVGPYHSTFHWEFGRSELASHALNSWRQHSLSYHGKALVINALAPSRIWYVASLIPIPPWVISELNSLVFKFFRVANVISLRVRWSSSLIFWVVLMSSIARPRSGPCIFSGSIVLSSLRLLGLLFWFIGFLLPLLFLLRWSFRFLFSLFRILFLRFIVNLSWPDVLVMVPSLLALWALVKVSIFVMCCQLPLSRRICISCLSVLFVLIVRSSSFPFLALFIGRPPGASFSFLIWIV